MYRVTGWSLYSTCSPTDGYWTIEGTHSLKIGDYIMRGMDRGDSENLSFIN